MLPEGVTDLQAALLFPVATIYSFSRAAIIAAVSLLSPEGHDRGTAQEL